jgi:hypothetical protein
VAGEQPIQRKRDVHDDENPKLVVETRWRPDSTEGLGGTDAGGVVGVQ